MQINHKIFWAIFIGLFFVATVFVTLEWKKTAQAIDLTTNTSSTFFGVDIPTREKNPNVIVKGLYLTAYSAGNPKKIDEIIKLVSSTELNAVVIDIKDYSGKILYDSRVPMVKKIKSKDNRLGDVSKLLKKLHDNNVYVIARQTVFQDPFLAEKKSEWAIHAKSGGLWRDRKGLAWVDPTRQEVWNYNLAIAKEAINLGFDEINFDYVRFPSDGNMSQVVYNTKDKKKYEVMGEFYKFIGENLVQYPAWVSLDMFGFVMEKKGGDDMNIGQRLADAVGAVDYICPMMYPSHYPAGHLGLANPAAEPGKVIANGMKFGSTWFVGSHTLVRPWLQAFNIGAVYDAAKIRAQIDEVEKHPNAGWLLWNAANRYSSAGLREE